MTIDEIAKRAHEDAKLLGWYDEGKVKSDLESLMMVVTEVVEAVEELRRSGPQIKYYNYGNPKPEGYGVEVADAIIRLLDFCAYKQIPIGDIIKEKLTYNLTRGYRHGNKEF